MKALNAYMLQTHKKCSCAMNTKAKSTNPNVHPPKEFGHVT